MTGGGAPRVPFPLAAGAAALFLCLAGAFYKDALGKGRPRDGIAKLEPSYWDTATVRKVRTSMTWDGAPCSSCHEGSEPLQGDPKEHGVFHEKIKLQHGRNQHCFNCHNRKNPAEFNNFDLSPIKLSEVQLLCAKCHGPTYRDWNYGAHGRRTGTWVPASKEQKPTACIACHDPHWPVFKGFDAMPAPHVNPRTPAREPHEEARE